MRHALALARAAQTTKSRSARLYDADGHPGRRGLEPQHRRTDRAHAEIVAMQGGRRSATHVQSVAPCTRPWSPARCGMVVHAPGGWCSRVRPQDRRGRQRFDLLADPRPQPPGQVEAGVLGEESGAMLSGWFRAGVRKRRPERRFPRTRCSASSTGTAPVSCPDCPKPGSHARSRAAIA